MGTVDVRAGIVRAGWLAAVACAWSCGTGSGASGGALAPRPDPRFATDPINVVSLGWIERRAGAILHDLVAALPADRQRKVELVRLVRSDALGEVNAFATCDREGPYIALGGGLLAIMAHLAMATATDQQFDTDRRRDYLEWLTSRGLAPPPVELYDTASHTDPRKVRRQHELLDEQLAFVLGHELAHHYLGHLACSSRDVVLVPADLGRELATALPVFSQLQELEADRAATENLLTAGARRPDYAWTEDGAHLVLAAFDRHAPLGAKDILAPFERTHPFPHLRVPAVTVAAEQWHVVEGLRGR